MSEAKDGAERREFERVPLRTRLDYRELSGNSFLFEYSTNISSGGIFIETAKPHPVGTKLELRFHPEGANEPLEVEGEVAWVNPPRDDREVLNPGMGIQFRDISFEDQAAINSIVQNIAVMPDTEL